MGRLKTFGAWVLVFGLLLFGISQYYLNQTYRMQLEAGYQRAFRELAIHVAGLETELSKLLVSSSPKLQLESAANILRLVYASQANLGQLPINSLNLTRTENLLAEIQAAAVNAAQSGFKLEDKLTNLYQQVQYLNGELQTQLALGERRTSWVDWRRYVQTSISRAAVEPDERYPLMQALVMIEDGMERFVDSNFPSELGRLQGPLPTGDPIAEAEAKAAAEAFLPEAEIKREAAVTNQTEGPLPTFTVTMTATDQSPVIIEVSKLGGHVLWMTNPRIVESNRLGKDEMVEKAEAFLNERGFPKLELIETDLRLNRLMCSYALLEDGVVIYPQHLKVQVAADNGEIVGFQGSAYHSFKNTRDLIPKLTAAEAQQFIKESAEIISQRLAVILDSNFNEVLTYEFRVNHGSDQFLIYINAADGAEVKITRIE